MEAGHLQQLTLQYMVQYVGLQRRLAYNEMGVRPKRYRVGAATLYVRYGSGCSFLITNQNWFASQHSFTFVEVTSQPEVAKWCFGQDIYGLSIVSAGVLKVTDTASYAGGQDHCVIDIYGTISSVSAS